MKKLLSLFLAVLMLLSLSSCGKAPKDISIEYDGDSVKKLEFDLNGDYDDEELTLTAVLEPKGAKGDIEWESSDKSVVRIKDNGDGTCTLKLKDEGTAKITASCGDLEAKVKITVEGSAAPAPAPAAEAPAAEAAVPAAEPAYSGPAVPDAVLAGSSQVSKPGELEYEVAATKNKAGLPFTPNDVLNSGILEAVNGPSGNLRQFVDFLKNGSGRYSFGLGDSELGVIWDNNRFQAVITNVNGVDVVYTFQYEGEFIRSIRADFGGGNVTELTLTCADDKMNTMKLTGYGGDRELTKAYDHISVDGDAGGFDIWFGSGMLAYLELGTGGSRKQAAELTFSCSSTDGDNCVRIWQLEMFDSYNTEYAVTTNYANEYYSPNSDTVCILSKLNDCDCRVSLSNSGRCYFTCSAGDISMDYIYESGKFYEATYRDSSQSSDTVYIDADGKKISK